MHEAKYAKDLDPADEDAKDEKAKGDVEQLRATRQRRSAPRALRCELRAAGQRVCSRHLSMLLAALKAPRRGGVFL